MKRLEDAFDQAYMSGCWGKPFYSGCGSHDVTLVNAYVECIK